MDSACSLYLCRVLVAMPVQLSMIGCYIEGCPASPVCKAQGIQSFNYSGSWRIRFILYTKQLGNLHKGPIQPPGQTKLLDYVTKECTGVIGGIVPGAGGCDAVAHLIANSEPVVKGNKEKLKVWGRGRGWRWEVRGYRVKGRTWRVKGGALCSTNYSTITVVQTAGQIFAAMLWFVVKSILFITLNHILWLVCFPLIVFQEAFALTHLHYPP